MVKPIVSYPGGPQGLPGPSTETAMVNRLGRAPIKWIRRRGDNSIDLAATFERHYGKKPTEAQLNYFVEVEDLWPIISRQVGAMILATAFCSIAQ